MPGKDHTDWALLREISDEEIEARAGDDPEAYQREHRIADGYDGFVVSPDVACLRLWHDR